MIVLQVSLWGACGGDGLRSVRSEDESGDEKVAFSETAVRCESLSLVYILVLCFAFNLFILHKKGFI